LKDRAVCVDCLQHHLTAHCAVRQEEKNDLSTNRQTKRVTARVPSSVSDDSNTSSAPSSATTDEEDSDNDQETGDDTDTVPANVNRPSWPVPLLSSSDE
jgi:hypothetical protein